MQEQQEKERKLEGAADGPKPKSDSHISAANEAPLVQEAGGAPVAGDRPREEAAEKEDAGDAGSKEAAEKKDIAVDAGSKAVSAAITSGAANTVRRNMHGRTGTHIPQGII